MNQILEKPNLPSPYQVLLLAKKAKKEVKSKVGRKSVLEPYVQTITYLRRSKRFTYSQIAKFFNEVGVKCTTPNLSIYARKHKLAPVRKRAKKTV
jgi:hypothetical protein